MTDPIRVPLSVHQQTLLATLLQKRDAAQAEANLVATAIVAGVMAAEAGTNIQIAGDCLLVLEKPDALKLEVG